MAYTQKELDEINAGLKTAQDAISWASDNLHPRVAKASSFGAEDAAIIHMMVGINPEFRFFTLDTGRLPQETYDIMDMVRKTYNVKIEVLFPDAAEVEEMVRTRGVNLFYDSVENRKLCCQVRKINPINKILKELDGWISGLRRDQTQVRSNARMLEMDEAHGIVKINPIIDWTWEDVWRYIRQHDIPYNSLLDRGYPSIGCQPCTRAVKPGEDIRAGRWWWEQGQHKECGLHIGQEEKVRNVRT